MCNRVSILIWDRYAFALLCFVSGAENSCNPLSQSDSTLNATASCSLVFSRASINLSQKKLINLLSFWLIVKFSYPLISYRDHFGFFFKHSFIERSIMRKYR